MRWSPNAVQHHNTFVEISRNPTAKEPETQKGNRALGLRHAYPTTLTVPPLLNIELLYRLLMDWQPSVKKQEPLDSHGVRGNALPERKDTSLLRFVPTRAHSPYDFAFGLSWTQTNRSGRLRKKNTQNHTYKTHRKALIK